MARRTKDAPGRVTPKGGAGRATAAAPAGRPAGGRYTAPAPPEWAAGSPWWVPALMFAFFGVGVIGIILNYLGVLPGGASNLYLVVGLALIVCGFVTATQYR